jgi:Xaa-Pro aminopeptidase
MLRRIGPAFVLVPREGKPLVIASFGTSMYLEKLKPDVEVGFTPTGMHLELPKGEAWPDMYEQGGMKGLLKAIRENKLDKGTIGIEKDDLPTLHAEALRKELPTATFEDAREALIDMKMVKTPAEIELVREANKRTCAAIKDMCRAIDEGVPETDVLRALKEGFLKRDCLWWHTTMGLGINGADPYHVAGMDGYIGKKGDPVRWDIGGVYKHYTSDLARTMCIKETSDEIHKLNDILRESTLRMIAAIKPGVPMEDIFPIGVEYVKENGYPHYKRGMMGHSVGIEVEEYPFIEPGEKRTFQPGMVFAVESPFYWKGLSGFNMEQNILVTETGTDVLSESLPFELIVCPYQGD